jgi:caffeoyl-CoA O-methyltransferase
VTFDKFTRLTPELHRYAVEHSTFRGGVTPGIEAAGEAMGDLAPMQIAGDQAAFMTILVRATRTRRALEVGTFLGYGAVAIARGLPDDGELVICELEQKYADRAAEHLDQAGLGSRADIRVAPAIDTLRDLPGSDPFDLAFVDADKGSYPDYYEECLRLLRPGGLLLLDNVFMSGRVLEDEPDESAAVIAELNDRIAADDRVEAAMLGFADGITVVLRK